MKNISGWARHHAYLARIIIATTQLFLFAGAVYTGLALNELGIRLSPVFFALGMALLIFSIWFYPALRKKRLRIRARYIRQKMRVIGIVVATFICVCFIFNDYGRVSRLVGCPPLQGSFITLKDSSTGSVARTNRFSKKEIRKQFKDLLKQLKKEKSEDRSGKILGVVLVIFGGVILTLLVAALSCNIACAGSEALAIVVAVFGITGIAFLVAWAIKKILRHKVTPSPENTIQ